MKGWAFLYTIIAIIIILITRVSPSTLERVERHRGSSLMFESTGMALGTLKGAMDNSSSNWGQGIALVLSPVALLALPATIIADAVSLPYDYYLYKKINPQHAFWIKANKNKQLLKDFSGDEKAQYKKNYGEYSAYFIHMKIRHSVGPKYIHPNKILFLYKLAKAHPEYKYSSNILRDISEGAHDLDDSTMDKFYDKTQVDIDSYKDYIVSMIKGDLNRDDKPGFAEKYYNIVTSKNNLKIDTKLAILGALEKTYKRNNRHMKGWVKYREEHLENEVTIGNGTLNEVANRERWLKGLERINEKINTNQESYDKLENRLSQIRKTIFRIQGVELIKYTQIKDPLPKIKFNGQLLLKNSCLKLKMSTETVTLVFPSTFNLNFLNGYSVIQEGENVLAVINSSFNISDTGYITSSLDNISVSPHLKCISDKYLIVGKDFGQTRKVYLGNITN